MHSYNIYISGVGGQGIIKTSVIMGESAMKKDLSVVVGEIHGMSQRGGVVSTQMKIGESYSPIIEEGEVDLLLAFEPLEALRGINMINKGSYVVMNTAPIYPFNIRQSEHPYPELSTIIEELQSYSKKVIAMDAEGIAKKVGHILSMNMVMLGGAAAVPGFPLDKDTIIKSMQDNLPERSIPLNMKAFEEGFSFCSSHIEE